MSEKSIKDTVEDSKDYRRFAALSAYAMLSAQYKSHAPGLETYTNYPTSLENFLPGVSELPLYEKIESILKFGIGAERLKEIREESGQTPTGNELKFILAMQSELPESIRDLVLKRELTADDISEIPQPETGKDSTEYLEKHGRFLHELTSNAFRLMDTDIGGGTSLMGKVASHSRNVAKAMTEAGFAIQEHLGEKSEWRMDKASATLTALSGLLLDMGRPFLFCQAAEAFNRPLTEHSEMPRNITWEELNNNTINERDIKNLFGWMRSGLFEFIMKHQEDGLFQDTPASSVIEIAEEIVFEYLRGEGAPNDSKTKILTDFVSKHNLTNDPAYKDIGMYWSMVNTFHANNVEFITRSPILAGVRAAAYHNVDYWGKTEQFDPDSPSFSYPTYQGQKSNTAVAAPNTLPENIATEIHGQDMSLNHELFRLMDKFVSRIEKDIDRETKLPSSGSFWKAVVTHLVSQHTYGQSAHPGLVKFLLDDIKNPQHSMLGKVAIAVAKEQFPGIKDADIEKMFCPDLKPILKDLRGLAKLDKPSKFWTGITTKDVNEIRGTFSIKEYVAKKFEKLKAEFGDYEIDDSIANKMANRPTGWAHLAGVERQTEALDTLRKHSNDELARFSKGSPALTGTHA